MSRLLFCTDIHLDHLPSPESARIFGDYLRREQEFDAVVVTGDVAEARSVASLLDRFAEGIGAANVYWIEGNHDHYGSSIVAAQTEFRQTKRKNVVWLNNADPVLLDAETALIGKYAWYDGVHGGALQSNVVLADFSLVSDLHQHFNERSWTRGANKGSRNALLAMLRDLANAAAAEVEGTLRRALGQRKRVVFATHVPPFPGACWYMGQLSNAAWMPWFTCDAMGKMLERVAAEHLNNTILVLCGHTHSAGVYQHAPNLRVLTGRAVYGAPDVSALVETTDL
jgi:UDP-2,3-diacylglucosamine pyrophosphatase LpxH